MAVRRKFADSWWGEAWVAALEGRARLDPNRLPRGRTYASKGQVRSIDLSAGRIAAVVQGSRTAPYQVTVGIRQLDDAEWDALLDAIASKAGHAAALLDGELTPAIVDDAERAGVQLLPGPGDLTPECSCPDWAQLCKHSAAVIYLVGTELDRDPFALLLLRGRTRDDVLGSLRRRRTGPGGRASGGGERPVDPGIVARDAWERPLAPLPSLPPRREQPGHAAPLGVEPPAHLGFTGASLALLANDAAARAWHTLRGDAGSALTENEDADLARRAAALLGTPGFLQLADRTGRRPRDLAAQAVAWQEAGGAGVRVLTEPAWTPPVARMAAARDVVIAGGAAPVQVRVRNNTISVAGRTQLRLSRDGHWYRLDKQGGRWELTAPAADEPDDLVFTRSDDEDTDDDSDDD